MEMEIDINILPEYCAITDGELEETADHLVRSELFRRYGYNTSRQAVIEQIEKEKEKVIKYVSFTIWAELEYGDGPLFWNGEKWSDDQSIYSFMDEDAARWCFMDCQNDLENIKSIKLVKSIVYRDEPDVEDIVLEEKEIIHE
jgi:hypothetical protein